MILRDTGRPFELTGALTIRALVEWETGRFTECRATLAEALVAAEVSGNNLKGFNAFVHFMLGSYLTRDISATARESLEHQSWGGLDGVYQGSLHILAGNVAEGLALLDTNAPTVGVHRNAHLGTQGLALALGGRREEAKATVAASIDAAPAIIPLLRAISSAHAAEAAALVDEPALAHQLYADLATIASCGCVVVVPLVERACGIAAAAGDDWTRAVGHHETALRQAHELPVVYEQPQVRYWYARMLLDRDEPGDRERARQLLTEAIDLFGEIGMPRHLEMAEELLVKAGQV